MNLVRMHRDPLFSNLVNQMRSEFDYEKKDKPAVNVLETEKEFKLQVSLAGWPKDQVKVEIDQNKLTLKGEHEESQNDYIRKEFKLLSFERSFTLPKDVIFEDIQAEHNNGILEILIPKNLVEKEKMKRLVSIK
ncbi:MAG: Hsp20 family protein [Bacteroidales bacterium]|nr:Hsp20 family protein [Bacteroidales bacterium]